MTQNNAVDIAFTPPPPPPAPAGYWPQPPGPPPTGGPRRRWPVLVAAGAVGAVVAAVAAAVITVQVRDTTPATAPQAHAPVTKTVPAPAPPSPAPLPASQADHQTCYQGWDSASHFTVLAQDALRVLPNGMKISDPAIQSNPDWTAALQKAGGFYQQASDACAGK